VAQRIADFSAGNARLALLAARGLRTGANLADLTDDRLFDRLFDQRKPADAGLLRAALALALVYSFAAETTAEGDAEVPFLARAAWLEPQDLHRAIGELTRREPMQARGPWQALLPLPLAHRLARRAYEDDRPLDTARASLDCGRSRLLRSFAHRLSYLNDAPGAQKIAAAWLGPGGPFADYGEVTRRGLGEDAQVFAPLAAVDQAAALGRIEEFVSTAAPSNSSPTPAGPAMAPLGSCASWPGSPSTSDAPPCCSGETSGPGSWSRSPSRITIRSPSCSRPDCPGTCASPAERLVVIEGLLSDPDPATQDTGLIALEPRLGSLHSPGDGDFSFGGHAIDFRWEPRRIEGYEAWYGGALGMAKGLAVTVSRLRGSARQAVANAFRTLWCFGQVFDGLEATACPSVQVGTGQWGG
jgi:hypothetical protein